MTEMILQLVKRVFDYRREFLLGVMTNEKLTDLSDITLPCPVSPTRTMTMNEMTTFF